MSVEVVTLTDPSSGGEAKIAVGYGFNCFQFRLEHAGRPFDVIWSEPDFEVGDKRASGSGIPLLFPYPGRCRGKTLSWQGQEYRLEGDDGQGNAIHGFVLTRPWRVIEQEPQRVVGQFQASVDEPRLLDCWPADFCVTATYQLAGHTLRSSFVVENPDDKPLPCGLGTHPYFSLPLGGSDPEACRVLVPATRRWEMIDMLPTGQVVALEQAEPLHNGLVFRDMTFDDVLSALEFHAGWCRARILDPQSGRNLVLEFDQNFRECVVYTPPHRQAVCIEPYTCVPNAVELESAGVSSGLRVLEPGGSFQAEVVMRVE